MSVIDTGLQFTVNSNGGKKHDVGKWDPSLMPVSFLKAFCAHMYKVGPAGKYGRNNWTKGMTASQCLNAAERHLQALKTGEDLDPETGTHHAISVAANMVMYFSCLAAERLVDDRVTIYPDLALRNPALSAK